MIQDDRPTPSPAKSTEYGVPAGHPGLQSDWPVRAAWLFAGVILPFFCLLTSYPYGPTWQSGKLNAYAQLLLSHKSSVAQYPLLLYSMICMVLVVLQPARFSNRTLVRLGIFTGVLLAAEHWLVFQFACSDFLGSAIPVILSAVAVFVPWLLRWLFGLLVQKFGEEPAVVVVSIVVSPLVIFFPWAIFICLWCSTPWAVASYLAVSIQLVRRDRQTRFRFSLAQLLIAFAWLSAHLGAWRISFLVMLREYASLPMSPPAGCFVCTAVAKGHFRVVRSEEYIGPGGTAFRVNDQLRCFKAFELMLASISPPFHRSCRRVYDAIGPKLAATIVHAMLADLGYLALKPAEWFAWACLALAIPGETELVQSLYRKQ